MVIFLHFLFKKSKTFDIFFSNNCTSYHESNSLTGMATLDGPWPIESGLLDVNTVDGRNPAPPGMVKTL